MTDHRAFGDFQGAPNVPNPAAVKGLFIYLFFDTRLPGIIGVIHQEAFATTIAPVALCPFFIMTVLD